MKKNKELIRLANAAKEFMRVETFHNAYGDEPFRDWEPADKEAYRNAKAVLAKLLKEIE